MMKLRQGHCVCFENFIVKTLCTDTGQKCTFAPSFPELSRYILRHLKVLFPFKLCFLYGR